MNTVSKKRVIVADDDEDDCMLLHSAFKETRIALNIEFVNDGIELMKLLLEEGAREVSFVLLDLNMPRKDGREVLKEIKQNPTLKKIPIIIFTTANSETEIRKCYEFGANTYIVKPDGFDELKKVVANLNNYWLDTASMPQ